MASNSLPWLSALALLACLPLVRPTDRASQRLLLILLDGVRSDHLNQSNLPLPGFQKMAREGVKVGALVPEFPTLSVPNWFSLTTGLHTESHTRTGNNMHDPVTGDTFQWFQYPHTPFPHWWQEGEPIWITAARQNKTCHMYHWPGCEVEVQGFRPRVCRQYSGVPTLQQFRSALDTSLSLLRAGHTHIAAIYHEQTDHVGHVFGPFSPEMNDALRDLDPILSDLVDQLTSDPGLSKVNLMVFSDHGMTEISPSRVIDLTTVLDPSDGDLMLEGGALASVYTAPDREDQVFEKLKNHHPNLTVYRKSDLPERWHFKGGRYVAPLTAVADLGWFIQVPQQDGLRSMSKYRGMHGYDNAHTAMTGIFLGLGPAFNKGQRVQRLRNVDLYQVMCHVLNIRPSPHNGSRADVTPLLQMDDVESCSVGLAIFVLSVAARFVISR